MSIARLSLGVLPVEHQLNQRQGGKKFQQNEADRKADDEVLPLRGPKKAEGCNADAGAPHGPRQPPSARMLQASNVKSRNCVTRMLVSIEFSLARKQKQVGRQK